MYVKPGEIESVNCLFRKKQQQYCRRKDESIENFIDSVTYY